MSKKVIYFLIILFCLSISNMVSGCCPYLQTLFHVVPVRNHDNWNQDHRNSFVFSCGDCVFNIDFLVIYESGDHTLIKKVKGNPLLFNIFIRDKQNLLPLNKESFSFSDKSILLSKNSVPITLADFRENAYENKCKKFIENSYYYEYGLSGFEPENNAYSLKFNEQFEIFDSKNLINCSCSIPSLDFKIMRNKELWMWTPGHSGPLF